MNRVSTKRSILCLVLALGLQTISVPLKALTNNDLKKLAITTGVLSCATSIWAIYERSKANSLGNQVIDLESQIKEETKDKSILASVEEYIVNINNEFQDLILTLDGNKNLSASVLKRILNNCVSKFNNTSDSNNCLDNYLNNLENYINKSISLERTLKDRISIWKACEDKPELYKNQKALSKIYLSQSERFLIELVNQKTFLTFLKAFVSRNRAGLKLNMFLLNSDRVLWQEENSLINKKETVDQKLRILESFAKGVSKNKDHQFALVQYAKEREEEKNNLLNLINNLKSITAENYEFDVADLYVEHLRICQDRYSDLVKILDLISGSFFYQKELADKYEFELRKQRQEAEIKERHQRLEAERLKKEAEWQREKNKQKKLEVEKANIRKDIEAYETQQKQIRLELERIRNGNTTKEAVEKNSAEWSKKLSTLKQQHEALIAEKNKLSVELSKLKSNNKKDLISQNKLEQKIEDLQAKINRSSKLADEIYRTVGVLPTNTPYKDTLFKLCQSLSTGLKSNW